MPFVTASDVLEISIWVRLRWLLMLFVSGKRLRMLAGHALHCQTSSKTWFEFWKKWKNLFFHSNHSRVLTPASYKKTSHVTTTQKAILYSFETSLSDKNAVKVEKLHSILFKSKLHLFQIALSWKLNIIYAMPLIRPKMAFADVQVRFRICRSHKLRCL